MSNGRRLRRSVKGVRGTSKRRDPKRTVGHKGRREDIAIGPCRCGRTTVLWLPVKLCERCLFTAAAERGMDVPELEEANA